MKLAAGPLGVHWMVEADPGLYTTACSHRIVLGALVIDGEASRITCPRCRVAWAAMETELQAAHAERTARLP